jgi:flotillin
MRMKASAYKQYGDAAILAMVLEALPQIAAEVSAPLAKTDEIVLIGEIGSLKGQYHRQINCLRPPRQDRRDCLHR